MIIRKLIEYKNKLYEVVDDIGSPNKACLECAFYQNCIEGEAGVCLLLKKIDSHFIPYNYDVKKEK